MMSILRVEQLSITARDSQESIIRDVSFEIAKGGIVGLVGESGSGKSTTALAIADLMPENFELGSGRILLEGEDLCAMSPQARRAKLASRVGFVYQDALTALNPLMRVGPQIGELLGLQGEKRAKVKEAVLKGMHDVGLEDIEFVYKAFPFELSGGMRQRVLIAMALITKPCLLIADESTTALDRRLSDQIIELLKRENREHGTSILFISHDISSVARLADELLVMKDGVLLERGKPAAILGTPSHDYTKMLLAAIPTVEKKGRPLGMNDIAEDGVPEQTSDWQDSGQVVMRIRDLNATYGQDEEEHVLEDIDLDIYQGEFMGLLGESGSGKTTIARVLTGQLHADKGEVVYHDRDIIHLRGRARREATLGLGMIFQDPYSSLDPHMSIFRQIEEPLIIAGYKDAQVRKNKVYEMLDAVDLDRHLANRRPAKLSGGQRQRVAIAIATILEPELLIADEAVASLDVSVQAQILNLLLRLRDRIGFSCLFIAHDLEVVYYLCDRVAVLYEGRIVECDTVEKVFTEPKHPYTKDLISRLHANRKR